MNLLHVQNILDPHSLDYSQLRFILKWQWVFVQLHAGSVACSSKNIRCNTSGLPRTISNRELLIRWLFQWSFITYNSIYLILAKLNHKHSLFIRDVMSSFPLLSKSRKKCFHHLPLHLVKNDCQFFLRAHSDVCINILPKICLKFFS